jgi:hypothetical protein
MIRRLSSPGLSNKVVEEPSFCSPLCTDVHLKVLTFSRSVHALFAQIRCYQFTGGYADHPSGLTGRNLTCPLTR